MKGYLWFSWFLNAARKRNYLSKNFFWQIYFPAAIWSHKPSWSWEHFFHRSYNSTTESLNSAVIEIHKSVILSHFYCPGSKKNYLSRYFVWQIFFCCILVTETNHLKRRTFFSIVQSYNSTTESWNSDLLQLSKYKNL